MIVTFTWEVAVLKQTEKEKLKKLEKKIKLIVLGSTTTEQLEIRPRMNKEIGESKKILPNI